MRSYQSQNIRCGHSFIELVTAMASSALLLAGLSAVLMISRQIAYAPTASNARLTAARVVNRLSDELRSAKWVMDSSPTAIEFVIADRNADGAGERIRYEWTDGDLQRTINNGPATTVVAGVEDFLLEYAFATTTDRLYPVSESTVTVLAFNTNVQGNVFRPIGSGLWVSQQINPSLPAGAVAWNATRVEFYGRRNGSGGTTLVQLRSSGAPNHGPTSEVLGATSIADASLSGGAGWNSATFGSEIRGLAPGERCNLVWASANTGCFLQYADGTSGSGSGVSETSGSNPGAAWQYNSSRNVFYRLYGTYATVGTPVDVKRSRIAAVRVTLQTDDTPHSRIESSTSLKNEPTQVSAVWRADFEPDPLNPTALDPTAIDVDGNGYASNEHDWMMGSGAFAVNAVNNGQWTVSGSLQSRPLNNFTDVTSIDARCRLGGVLRINADRQGGTHGPLIVRVVSSGGKQTLTLSGESAASTEKVLATVERLPTNWVRFRLLIVPQENCVRLTVNDRMIGTYAYPPPYNTNTTDRCISVSGTGSQFDYVEACVLRGTTVELVN